MQITNPWFVSPASLSGGMIPRFVGFARHSVSLEDYISESDAIVSDSEMQEPGI